MQSNEKLIRSLAFSAVVVFCAAASAVAEIDPPVGCARGRGTYSGDIEGIAHYEIKASYAAAPYRSTITIFDDMIRGTQFDQGGSEPGWEPTIQAKPFLVPELDATGSFSISEESVYGHVLTLDGGYSNCKVTGSWTLTYADRPSLPMRTGTFEIIGSTEYDWPADGGSTGGLCGPTTASSAAMLFAVCVGVSAARRRRHRAGAIS
ncbi:MAG TPA: hypothetical protein VNT79_18375 [Phycisphaerae bacterium]|nr:hypothetical protein [Phycisphaerae bacterium]